LTAQQPVIVKVCVFGGVCTVVHSLNESKPMYNFIAAIKLFVRRHKFKIVKRSVIFDFNGY